MQRKYIKSVWSAPVANQCNTLTNAECERGKPGGVAVLSTCPLRPCLNPVPLELKLGARFVHAIATIGQMQFQLVTVYGFPQNRAGAKDATNRLLADILPQVQQIPLPFLVAGDFNIEVDQLQCWTQWEQLGCKELKQLHQEKYACEMRPTCMESTWPDNCIVSPTMQPFVTQIEVMKCDDFPTHAPVVLTLQIPTPQPCKPRLQFPKSFLDFGLTKEDLQKAVEEFGMLPSPPLEEWGDQIETLVARALQLQPDDTGKGTRSMTRAYKGRCKPLQPVLKPIFCSTKLARQGDYNPPHEITTFSAKAKLKQFRRIQSLRRQLVAHSKDGENKWYRSQPALTKEWHCILTSHSFGMPFAQWLWEHPDIGPCPWPLPTDQWLHHVEQLVKFELDAHVEADRAASLAFLKAKENTSAAKQEALKRSYKYVRTNVKPPVRELLCPFEQTCHATWMSPTQVTLHLDPDVLQLGTPVHVDEGIGWITGSAEHEVHVTLSKLPSDQQETPVVQQKLVLTSPEQMVDQLNGFWLPIWQNEDVPTASQLQQFDDLVRTLPFSIPPISVDTGVDIWCAAVQRLKGSTARGFDALSGWEAKLLPREAWQHLADCILGYIDGLPDWLMRARTCPLSKVDQTPSAQQVRPITVLPLVYRIYASVVCRQILWSWNQHFPSNITGLLPSRGAFDAAYNSQLLLEIAHARCRQVSGLTLDLKKAFNMIWHHVGPPLLKKFGVPDDIVVRWSKSIAKLTRYWDVHQGTYGPQGTSRGFPDGDSHSVLIMLAISLLWIFSVVTDDEGASLALVPTAYADNWGWTTEIPVLHNHAAKNTLLITSLCGLSVDWSKTWMFATSTAVAKQASDAILAAVPVLDLPRPHHAKDLGIELRYSGTHQLGHKPERYQVGFGRLKRLQHLPLDPETKEIVWMVSIYPAAFYGCETRPPADNLVSRMRTKVADAIFGSSSSMAPAVALLFGKRHLLDPGFQLVMHALRAARRWLYAASAAERRQFYDMVAKFRGGIAKVRGPAAALSLYLKQLEWELTREGFLLCGPFLQLHLLDSSFSDILILAQRAWQTDIFLKHTERKLLFHLQPSRVETTQALKPFHGAERGNLVREIAGAFQTNTQKAKWSSEHSEACPYCGGEDTRHHRTFECPAFADIRTPFQEHLDWLVDNYPLTADLPVVLVHEDADVHQVMQFHDSDPVIGQEFFHVADDRRTAGKDLYLYTDGSGQFPGHAATRYCGFSVVMDLCDTDDERCAYAMSFLATGEVPASFQTVCRSRLKGRQTVPRAELAALEVATRFCGTVTIFSDCQSALTAVDNMQQGSFDFLRGNNVDLVRAIQRNWHSGLVLRKIKAHTDLKQHTNMLHLYHALGNHAADLAAGVACTDNHEPFLVSLAARHSQQAEYISHMQELYKMLLMLQQARQQAEINGVHVQAQESLLEVAQTTGTVDILAGFAPNPGRLQMFDTSREDMFQFFPWGVQLATLFRDWFTELVWTTGEVVPPCCRGISWLELALSFGWYLGAALPIQRVDDTGLRQLVMVSSVEDLLTFHITLGDQSRCMQNLWTHFCHMLPAELQPPGERGLQRSLMWYGFQQHVSGLSIRPKFPGQHIIVPYIAEQLHGRSSYDVSLVLPWVSADRRWPLEEHDWVFLRDIANRRRKTHLRQLAA
eukprot:Skav205786  [mRNA]  locus=scaffold340:103108:108078:+ [translate_table: standard]